MSRDEFDAALDHLRERSNALADLEKSAENFDDIVEKRIAVDHARAEVTLARRKVVSRFEPPAPDLVEPARGYQHTRLFGKIGAGIACLVIAGIVVMAFQLIQELTRGGPLEIEQLTETIDDDCRWRVEVVVRNTSDNAVRVDAAETVLDRQMVGARVEVSPAIAPGQTNRVVMSWAPTFTGGCGIDPDEIDHGRLVLTSIPVDGST